MINNKRAFVEINKLKRNIIWFILGVTLCSALCQNILDSRTFQISFWEIIVVILCGIFLLTGLFFYKKDEEQYPIYKARYYHYAYSFLVAIAIIGYAICFPLINIKIHNIAYFQSIFSPLIFFLCGYSIIYCKAKGIYFSYNFITENNKTFYRKVFRRIFKMVMIGIAMALLSTCVALIYKKEMPTDTKIISFTFFQIFMTFLFCLGYLFKSIMEKSSYNQASYSGISRCAIVIAITSLSLSISLSAIWLNFGAYFINLKNLSQAWNDFIAFQNLLGMVNAVLIIIAFAYIYDDLKDEIPSKASLKVAYINRLIIFYLSFIILFFDQNLYFWASYNYLSLFNRFTILNMLYLIFTLGFIITLYIACKLNQRSQGLCLSFLIVGILFMVFVLINRNSKVNFFLQLLVAIFNMIILTIMLLNNEKQKPSAIATNLELDKEIIKV